MGRALCREQVESHDLVGVARHVCGPDVVTVMVCFYTRVLVRFDSVRSAPPSFSWDLRLHDNGA